MAQDTVPTLKYQEFNAECTSTILFIHGGVANSTTWNPTAEHLKDYHILAPDLPGHGLSRAIYPSFSPIVAAQEVASLIRAKARGGKARIVGLSLGAHIALQIISRYPEVVDEDVILTGYNVYPMLNITMAASLGWFGRRIGNLFPESQEVKDMKKTADGIILPPMPYSYWKEVLAVICTEVQPPPWSARTLFIVAGNKGGSPVTDRRVSARKMSDIGRKGNASTAAYWNSKLLHAWPMFDGQLTTDIIHKWVNKLPLGEEFELL